MAYAITKDTPVIQLHAKTHFPIKLIATNFLIWQRQVRSTLIGLDLFGYVDDQAIIGALLGSCTDTIQPLISNVETAREAWLNLHSSFVSASRGHVLALKSKLGKNPRGNRSINDYLHEMRSLANELELAQNPISEEDLVVHILNQLGAEFDSITSTAYIRESTISFTELGDVLRNFECKLKVSNYTVSSMVAMAHSTQRHMSNTHWSHSGYPSASMSSSSHRGPQQQGSVRQHRRGEGSASCQFCSNPGHDIKVCRKLARLLRDNGVVLLRFGMEEKVDTIQKHGNQPKVKEETKHKEKKKQNQEDEVEKGEKIGDKETKKKGKGDKDKKDGKMEKNSQGKKDPTTLKQKLEKIDSKMQVLVAKKEEILKMLAEVEKSSET
ncbi:hypothetical protein DM860_011534 [Cuscuta australis]|uniref:Retrotransposon Copia-like N-terminal domain-containing protein n=1 Tax=Cuscuta australis TaxID=267555 RepID=A0A328D3A1_9ASTE|nr:hypothetical protein DM860_011534 [Cuscuta australis]